MTERVLGKEEVESSGNNKGTGSSPRCRIGGYRSRSGINLQVGIDITTQYHVLRIDGQSEYDVVVSLGTHHPNIMYQRLPVLQYPGQWL